jgi:hypothetical protein
MFLVSLAFLVNIASTHQEIPFWFIEWVVLLAPKKTTKTFTTLLISFHILHLVLTAIQLWEVLKQSVQIFGANRIFLYRILVLIMHFCVWQDTPPNNEEIHTMEWWMIMMYVWTIAISSILIKPYRNPHGCLITFLYFIAKKIKLRICNEYWWP